MLDQDKVITVFLARPLSRHGEVSRDMGKPSTESESPCHAHIVVMLPSGKITWKDTSLLSMGATR